MGCQSSKGVAPPQKKVAPPQKKEEPVQDPKEEPREEPAQPAEEKKEEKSEEKRAPDGELRPGDVVTVAKDGGIEGTVVRATTTDVLVKTGGAEEWFPVEDAVQWNTRPPLLTEVQVGRVVTTADGGSGTVVSRSTCDVTLRAEDGKERTVDVEDIVVAKVTIVKANDLRNADLVTKSDPYATCQIVGQPQQVKTHYVSDNLNPIWNFEACLLGFREGDSLKFDIFDYDVPIKKDDFLGTVTLQCKEFMETGFYGALPLEGERAQGTVTVRVRVDPRPGSGEGDRPAEDEAPQPERPEPVVTDEKQHPTGWCC